MTGLRMAFQHSGRVGPMKLVAPVAALLDHGPYSHTEIQLPDGTCCSSVPGSGVVMRKLHLDPAHFDFLPLSNGLLQQVVNWYEAHQGHAYDWRGNLRFLAPLVRESSARWFCSESNLAALGVPQPWRHGPTGAYHLIKWRYVA
jgi:hypothetical protein